MKLRLTVILMAACLTFLMACESPLNPIEEEAPYLTVLTLTGTQQRLAFNLLSPAEKALAWQQRFQRVLAFEATMFNKNADRRITLIEEVEAIATNPDNFSPDMTEEDLASLEKGILAWKDEADEVFAPEEIENILFTLSSDSSLVSLGADKANATRQCLDCCCHVASMMTCPRVSFSFKDAGLSFGECGTSWACPPGNETRYGCGAFKMYSCNGGSCEFS